MPEPQHGYPRCSAGPWSVDPPYRCDCGGMMSTYASDSWWRAIHREFWSQVAIAALLEALRRNVEALTEAYPVEECAEDVERTQL